MLNIIYEDAKILVCHKPAGLAVQNASFGKKDLESMVRNYLAEQSGRAVPYLGVIHRLDQPVQGVTVFAKDNKSAASLSAQVQDGRMKKYYLAVTDGIPEKEEAELVHYLKKDGRTNTSSVVDKNVTGAKRANLRYRVIQTVADKEQALLEIELFTGRHHQIRVQMANIGCPIWGDSKYNTAPIQDRRFRQIALCAYRLEFEHPKTKEKMKFEIEPKGEGFHLLRES